MADLNARAMYQQSLTGVGTWDVIFNAGTASSGLPLRGVELSCVTQDVLVRIYGLHDSAATIVSERLVAGASPVQRFSFNNVRGLITKIEANPVVAGGKVTLNPIIA